MLSISTCKNQITKIRGALYIPNMSIITKLSQDVSQYYKNIISLIDVKLRIQENIQV